MIALPAPVAVMAVPDAEAGARAFLGDLYAGYGRPGGRGAPLDRPERLFEPRLAAAIRADAAAAERRHEIGKLDFDPFCAGQDWTPFTPLIDLVVTGGSAGATVRFVNGRPVVLHLDLVRTKAGWRVADVSGTDVQSVRRLFLARG